MKKKRWFVKILQINKGVGQLLQSRLGAVNDSKFDADQAEKRELTDGDAKKN